MPRGRGGEGWPGGRGDGGLAGEDTAAMHDAESGAKP